MVNRIDTAVVMLWGKTVGAVSWLDERHYAIFEYEPAFLDQGLDISPIHMGLSEARRGDARFMFPTLNKDTFLGLPGLLSDALPDKFGNAIIDAWLARKGRDRASFSPVERLCYTGKRTMGALEFAPPLTTAPESPVSLEISDLVDLVQQVMDERSGLQAQLDQTEVHNTDAIMDILRVGTSAGGARPKAVIALNDAGDVISGQTEVPAGYEYWLLKFDGVHDLELGAPGGYGRIEYAYYKMARAAGIRMSPCRLLEENGRAHFMTQRFDRKNGEKLHMQTLCGIAHYDFNMAGAYSYEQAFSVMRQLRLSKAEAAEQYRRMVFNVIARNQDDHTKNISFLMDQSGKWRLSPAYDVTYSHNPAGKWTRHHQMSINNKRDDFNRSDLIKIGESISLKRPDNIIDEVISAVNDWPRHANDAGVNKNTLQEISRYHRTRLF